MPQQIKVWWGGKIFGYLRTQEILVNPATKDDKLLQNIKCS